MAAFESEEVINMDEEIEKRNEDNILHSGLRAWLKKINLLEYSGKFLENGYDDLDQLRSMTGEDLAEVTSDVGLVEMLCNQACPRTLSTIFT